MPRLMPWGVAGGCVAVLAVAGVVALTIPSRPAVADARSAGPVQSFVVPLAKPDDAVGALEIAAGPDGNVWFTSMHEDRIGRITPLGSVREFRLADGAQPAGVTAGPDGNVWFTEPGLDRVARITPAGTVTEFASGVPRAAGLGQITTGADNNVWFTARDARSIGRITRDGAITMYRLVAPRQASRPTGLAAGPDGAMWVTLPEAGTIARVPVDGGEPEFFTEGIAPGAKPNAIALGADGNLWFTESDRSVIGRITPSGQVTEFNEVLVGPVLLEAIVRGPDGKMWFLDTRGHRLGRITPQGASTDVWYLSARGLTSGLDRHLWLASYGEILRVDPRTSPIPVVPPFKVAAGRDRTGRLAAIRILNAPPYARVRVTRLCGKDNCIRPLAHRDKIGSEGTATLPIRRELQRRGPLTIRISVYFDDEARYDDASYGRFRDYRVNASLTKLRLVRTACLISAITNPPQPCPRRPPRG